MPLMQDRSIDLLTSSPARYHCSTDAPVKILADDGTGDKLMMLHESLQYNNSNIILADDGTGDKLMMLHESLQYNNSNIKTLASK